jgi:hypothetical protein
MIIKKNLKVKSFILAWDIFLLENLSHSW